MKYALQLCNLLIDVSLMALPKRGRSMVTGIIRLDAIGDFVVWLPAAQALVAHLKQERQRIVLIANQLWAPWASEILEVDEVVLVDVGRLGRSLSYRLSTLKRVREIGLSTIITPTYSRIPIDGNDAIAFASGASTRIANKGYRSRHVLAGWVRRFLNLGYSQLIENNDISSTHSRPVSELEINARFNRGFGCKQNRLIAALPVGDLDGLQKLGLPSIPYVVLMPGGSWSGKAWPLERFVTIARQLVAEGYMIVVAGSAGEKALCEELALSCNGISIAGATTLQTLAEVIRCSHLMIGNDSAGIHIAVAAGVDSVCVMWGGSFGRFIPYKKEMLPRGLEARTVYRYMDCFGCTGPCPHPTVSGKVKCIDAVPVSEVWATVHDILGKK